MYMYILNMHADRQCMYMYIGTALLASYMYMYICRPLAVGNTNAMVLTVPFQKRKSMHNMTGDLLSDEEWQWGQG